MPVSVDEAGNGDAARRVDDLRPVRFQSFADRQDAAVRDQHVALQDVAERVVHRDDARAADQEARRHHQRSAAVSVSPTIRRGA